MAQFQTFIELVSRCKGSVTISVNDHRSIYETVEEWLLDSGNEPSADVVRKMIKDDITVKIQFYPDTPVGFHVVVHHDVNAAIEAAHKILDS